jgi:hypothetical protein
MPLSRFLIVIAIISIMFTTSNAFSKKMISKAVGNRFKNVLLSKSLPVSTFTSKCMHEKHAHGSARNSQSQSRLSFATKLVTGKSLKYI